MIGTRRALKLAAISTFLALAACGGATPPPPAPAPVPAPEPPPPPEPVAEEPPPADPAPAAETEPASTGRAPSGRPPLFFSNPTKITEQVGETPATKFELGGAGGAILRIPEYALGSGYLVTFAVDKKAKRHKGAAGETYRLQGQVPPSAEYVTIETAGPPFELELPKAGAAANLAVGEVKVDESGKETITWTVVAPKAGDEASKAARFELTAFTNAILHLTTESPAS